jgi:copper chaperone CopZ
LTKIEGIKSHTLGVDNVLTVVFDDQKVTVQQIITSLEEADLPPEGAPVMIK